MAVIALIRTSTISQEVESQRDELLSFIKSDGINENDIIVVGQAGASAIKVDDAYKRNINEVYRLIEEGNITAVYAWAIDRIGRQEEILFAFKNRLIEKRIQLVIKNPNLRLLDNDGKVNSGMEMAFSLFATMSKQEMESKKARFERAKRRNADNGKYNGGRVHYGYLADENGKIVINDDEAKLIELIYNLYASGEYSTTTLTKELQNRGYKMRGKNISLHFVTNMLNSTAFIGYSIYNKYEVVNGRKTNKLLYTQKRTYPRIISDELFNKVQERLSANHKGDITKKTKHIHLASKLIICPTCGRHWFASNRAYQCIGHKHHGKDLHGYTTCPNGESISCEWLDIAVWCVAKKLEFDYIMDFTENRAEEAQKQIEVNNQKITTLEGKIAKIDDRRKRIAVMYIEGEITKAEQTKQADRIKSDIANYEREIVELKEQNNKLNNLISFSDNGILISTGRLTVSGIYEDVEDAYKITHRHIKSVRVENIDINGRTQKLITVTSMMGDDFKIVYIPKSKLKHGQNGTIYKLFKMDGKDLYPLVAYPDFVQPFE